jgi:hypothetical protein
MNTSDREILKQFENYMIEKKIADSKVKYNTKVVRLLMDEVLYVFDQGVENIDVYSFEEFTDMVTLIDKELGGRSGLVAILEAMQELTQFLKEFKYIKGGKIAYYKRMFAKTDYYLDKYDMMTGKKDDSRNFVKKATSNKLSSSVIKLIEEINLYEYDTLNRIDKLLNDVPIAKSDMDSSTILIRCMLIDLNLLEEKGTSLETTKKGRAISRLSIEERYGALIHLMFDCVDWKNVIKVYNAPDSNLEFTKFLNVITSIFNKKKIVEINFEVMKNIDEESMLVEIASDRFRLARAESMTCGMQIMDICFLGMGILESKSNKAGNVIYSVTAIGEDILKLIYNDCAWHMKNQISKIGDLIKNRKFDEAEVEIIDFLSVFGANIIIWSYLGQLLMIKKQYQYAYTVLKYAYENSSKRGKSSKTVLYYLVMCCRKLKLKDDIKNYEIKLQSIEKN